MCGIISQEEYRNDYPEQIVAEYTKEGFDNALLVKDRWDDHSVILSADGQEYQSFYYTKQGNERPANKQRRAAEKYLVKHGYTLKAVETEQVQETPAPTHERVPGIAELATTYDRQPIEDTVLPENAEYERTSPDIYVQGRSLQEWEEVSTVNQGLPHEMHTHPQRPTDRPATTAEVTAYINSLTIVEALIGLISLDAALPTGFLAEALA